MKTRYFILTTLAMALLAVSCQKAAVGGAEESEEAPVPIQLTTNLKVNSVSVTKAAVGAWAEQKLYIYALPTNEIPAEDDSKILVNNAEALAPMGGTDPQSINLYDATATVANTYYYYPADKSTLDFYGYYVDNAFINPALNTPDKPAPEISENDKISLPLYLDGSQDIMLAKADKEEDVQKITDEIISPGNAYGAYSARKGVVPNLKFEHLLSRFVFYVVAGNAEGMNVEIQSLTLESQSTANLVIASKDVSRGITGSGDKGPFYLMDDNGAVNTWFPKVNLETEESTYKIESDTQNRVGESIMVIPDSENGHKMVIMMQQKASQSSTAGDLGNPFYITETLTPDRVVIDEAGSKAQKFLAGYQYNVNIVVYGRQKVEVMVTLSEWKAGGSITIDHDKEVEEPQLGYKATGPDNKEYYLYFYSKPIAAPTGTTPGTEVKYWDKNANEMAAPEAGRYIFETPIGENPTLYGVDLVHDAEGNKTTVLELITVDPNS